jgi:type IV pilus assembly protein PilM
MLFKRFINTLFKGSSKISLGLDIGSHTVKAVQLEKNKEGNRLLSYDIVEISGFEQDFERVNVAEAVKEILKGKNLEDTKLVTSVGGSQLVIRQIHFPLILPKELESSLRFEVSQHIPFPIDEVELKFQILSRNQSSKTMEVLLVAITRKTLEEHLQLVDQLELRPAIIDVNPLALMNCLLAKGDYKKEEAVVLLDIGAQITTLSIFREGLPYFTRDIMLAGNDFTRQLRDKKSLSFSQAEKLKKAGKWDLKLLEPILSQLVSEIQQSLLYFDKRTEGGRFERINLSGGSARTKGLESFLSDRLSLPVNIVSPFKNILMEGEYGPNEELNTCFPQLTLALGLALRGK